MSWSLKATSEVEKIDLALDCARAEMCITDEYARDQMNIAMTMAKQVIASHCVVRRGQKVSVYISGHANPEHLPRDGYANDSIQISVYQEN